MDTYFIRLACKSDLPKLQEIEIKAANRFKGMGLIDHLLEESFCSEKLSNLINKKQAWVACTSSELVGFILVSVIEKSAFIEELDVLPEHGRHGLGTKFITAVCEWAKSKRLHSIFLSTFKSILWNAPFYKRLGFEILLEEKLSLYMHQIREHEKSIGLPIEERVFMELAIKVTQDLEGW